MTERRIRKRASESRRRLIIRWTSNREPQAPESFARARVQGWLCATRSRARAHTHPWTHGETRESRACESAFRGDFCWHRFKPPSGVLPPPPSPAAADFPTATTPWRTLKVPCVYWSAARSAKRTAAGIRKDERSRRPSNRVPPPAKEPSRLRVCLSRRIWR